MQIKLNLKEKNVEIVLLDGENTIDKESWIDENNLLEKFFPIVDDVLKRNNIDINSVEKFDLETDMPSGYTTVRIARTIVKTLNLAHKS